MLHPSSHLCSTAAPAPVGSSGARSFAHATRPSVPPPSEACKLGRSRTLPSFRQAKQTNSARPTAVRCSAQSQQSTSLQDVRFKTKQLDTITATVDILKEDVFDLSSHALSYLLGQKVKMQLVSLDTDPETKEAKRSSESDMKFCGGVADDDDSHLTVRFSVPKNFGKPGAILIESQHPNEFFLNSISLEMPDTTKIHFPCHSWIVDNKFTFGQARVFFANQVYLPNETPPALAKFRIDDLVALRGDGQGQRRLGERIYDYDVYNDLGNPDKDKKLARPVLGGTAELPYPRRCRTGGEAMKTDPKSEKPASGFDGTYMPRDERFSPRKLRLFIAAGLRCFGHDVFPILQNLVNEARSFDALHQIYDLYVGALRSTSKSVIRNPRDGTVVDFPPPGVVQANSEAWRLDQEFGRQRLAGSNPLAIERLKEFPPVSKLDPEIYGPATSSITAKHLEKYLEGLTVEEALKQKRLYILDYHDAFMPYVNRINELDAKLYASRTIFFLRKGGVLTPIAIELSLPPKQKGDRGVQRVFSPSPPGGPEEWLWSLAKSHVAAVDAGFHQLISHWLRTHACMEPFIIATVRQLSALHPVHVLLAPHFKDTLNINAMARAGLINANGIIESSFSPMKYSMEISSVLYKSWRFDEQALPRDLSKRGMAEEDPQAKHGLRLNIEDYPFAADGLDLWAAIKQWVTEYLAIYYKNDEAIQQDIELQSWWMEIKNVGHGDHAGASWWASMRSVDELVEAVTTIIWVMSGHHAAVNFGQYAYAGFMPNSPTIARRLIPEEGTEEYQRMLEDPEKYYLETVSTEGHTTLIMAVVEILAQHMGEEEYLGEREDLEWTSDPRALKAFSKFHGNLALVEKAVEERNAAFDRLHHRAGPVQLPYTLLIPSSSEGLTFRGVPNSISI